MGKQGLAGICIDLRHLRISPRRSVIAGYPRMGIRLRTGLELCNLRLWFTREFVQAGNGAFGLSARVGKRVADQRSAQKAQRIDGVGKLNDETSAGEAKSCFAA